MMYIFYGLLYLLSFMRQNFRDCKEAKHVSVYHSFFILKSFATLHDFLKLSSKGKNSKVDFNLCGIWYYHVSQNCVYTSNVEKRQHRSFSKIHYSHKTHCSFWSITMKLWWCKKNAGKSHDVCHVNQKRGFFVETKLSFLVSEINNNKSAYGIS